MFIFVKEYFRKAKNYSNFRFVLELTFVAFLLKLFFSIIFVSLFSYFGYNTLPDTSFEQSLLRNNLGILFIETTIFAGFETFTGQWLMLWLSSKFTKKTWIRIFFSALVFSAMHIEPLLISIVFPIGLVLAWAFLVRREERSPWEAFWLTTAIHTLHNLIVLYMISLGT